MTAGRSPISILCIDDDEACREVHKRLLEKAGYEVLECSNGEQGLILFSSALIDLVMIDYSMPGLDGASVACSMRSLRPGVPILMVSGQEERPAQADYCVDAYLSKSAEFEDILRVIERLLNQETGKERRLLTESDHSRARQDFFSLRGEVGQQFGRMGLEIAYEAGERLFTEGETQQYVFILLSGRVKLSAGSWQDGMAGFQTAEAGNILGLSSALNSGICEVTADALESCRARIIYTKEFLAFLEKYPEASMEATRCVLKEYEATLEDIRSQIRLNLIVG